MENISPPVVSFNLMVKFFPSHVVLSFSQFLRTLAMIANILRSISLYRKFIFHHYSTHISFGLSNEKRQYKRLCDFINIYGRFCLERSNQLGHLTVSAFVVNQTYDSAILTLHKKLNKWLQLGGHCDGESDLYLAVAKEIEEESGLDNFKPCFYNIKGVEHEFLPFDIDIHTIPAFKQTPSHLHFDIRYLFSTAEQTLKISEESRDLKWIPFSDISLYSNEKSLLAMFDKASILRSKGLIL